MNKSDLIKYIDFLKNEIILENSGYDVCVIQTYLTR